MVSRSSSPERGARPLSVTDRADGVAIVLAVAGVVDMAAAPVLAERMVLALRARPSVLIVDLSEVDFVATAGMSVVLAAHRRCQDTSTSCRVVAIGHVTLRPMQLLGIDEILEVYSTVPAALRGRG